MRKLTALLVFIAFMLNAGISKCQIVDPVTTTTDKVTDRTNAKIDNGIDQGLDKVEGLFKKKDKNKDKKEDGSTDNQETETGDAETQTSTTTTTKKDDPLTSYSKFDFIPGESLLFYDDFSQDVVGDFPAGWNTDASGEIVTTNIFPGKWLKLTAAGSFIPEYNKEFPENYTVEFDVIPDNSSTIHFYMYQAENPKDLNEGGAIPGLKGIKFTFTAGSHIYNSYDEGAYTTNGSSEKGVLEANVKVRFSVWVQKQRVRVYINETKVFDVPRAIPAGFKCNCIRFLNDDAPMIGNIRIAGGLPDMRNKLITEGKLVSYGLYFDSGSDKLKPQSYGTLKEIAAVLNENPTVKIKIVGYTDSDGGEALNLELSKKRAAAVKTAINTEFAIDKTRMETDGKGQADPVAPNTSTEGKAKNRRVEFIKL